MASSSASWREPSLPPDNGEDDEEDTISSLTPLMGSRIEQTNHTVFNPVLKAAIDDTRLDPLGRRAIALYSVCLVGFMNSVSVGFDISLMGGINAMRQYLDYFDYKEVGATTGIVMLIYIVGQSVGACFAGSASDRFGRRGGMVIGCTIILFGALGMAAAQNRAMFIVGRFMLGFGSAVSTTAAPTWVTELAPAHWRGRLGAAYNTFFFGGAIPATAVMVGSQTLNSTWAWRLPLLLQVIPPVVVLLCVRFCPESPRWLVSRGRVEEARAVMTKYHSNDGKSNPLIEFQLRECQDTIEVRKVEPFWDFSSLVDTANARWRFLALVLICLNSQFAGTGLMAWFLPTIFANAGVADKHTQLLYNFANTTLSCAAALIGTAFTDRINRRPRLYTGSLVLGVTLAVVAVLSSKFGQEGNTNMVGAKATIAMIFMFGMVHSFVYTPLQALYCAEVLDQKTRAKGMAVHIIIVTAAMLVNTFGGAVGLERWGYKYYFVYVMWNFFAAVLWFLFGVETRGRTLEELEDVFNEPWPAMSSGRKFGLVSRRRNSEAVALINSDV